ncbi:MAG: anaerobic ribonucleoside-triphosphate reductase activating protein [Clostridiales bacterium]|nr:anaerobic ribonucleoside-triphosphate reductase activating protein [Clostridiales bacterium]
MYYGEIKKNDVANGLGVRVSLFVSGCTHRCKNCFNAETWSFTYGHPFTAETEEELLAALAPSYINGLTLLGGEPFEPDNQRVLLPFLKRVRQRFPEKSIWCFTGSALEPELLQDSPWRCEVTDRLLSQLDVLVDGPFIEERKDISLRFRGSSNQRLLDMPATLEKGEAVLWDAQTE